MSRVRIFFREVKIIGGTIRFSVLPNIPENIFACDRPKISGFFSYPSPTVPNPLGTKDTFPLGTVPKDNFVPRNTFVSKVTFVPKDNFVPRDTFVIRPTWALGTFRPKDTFKYGPRNVPRNITRNVPKIVPRNVPRNVLSQCP